MALGAIQCLGRPSVGGKGDVASDLTRALFGTRSRLLSAVAVLAVLLVFLPILLLVLGFFIPAALSVLIGLIGVAGMVLALLPGRRSWR